MQRFLFYVFLFLFCLLSFRNKIIPTPYTYPDLFRFPAIPSNSLNPVTNEGVILGRHLFYDSILSINLDMSCASCHKQEYAFSDSPHALSNGNKIKTKRNSMPLFNLIWSPSFFWDGRANSIEEQVFHPLNDSNELNVNWEKAINRLKKNKKYRNLFKNAFNNSEIDSTKIALSIAQFLRTIISHESKFDKVLQGKEKFTKQELEGFEIANDQSKGDCLHCHTTDVAILGTTFMFSNNGIDKNTSFQNYVDNGRGSISKKNEDNGKFKIPSFRNLLFTSPYMHDGRFNTIEEVIDFYSEGVKKSSNIDSKMTHANKGGVKLSKEDKLKLIAFLKTLSDSSFIVNKKFSNPFYLK
jgi:cytochrome c peroxidase